LRTAPDDARLPPFLTCEECRCISGRGRGWIAQVAEDPEDGDDRFVVTYCLPCAWREFDGRTSDPHLHVKVSALTVAGGCRRGCTGGSPASRRGALRPRWLLVCREIHAPKSFVGLAASQCQMLRPHLLDHSRELDRCTGGRANVDLLIS
jgi:hypothetical protein